MNIDTITGLPDLNYDFVTELPNLEEEIRVAEEEIRILKAVPWNSTFADIAREYLVYWVERLAELEAQR